MSEISWNIIFYRPLGNNFSNQEVNALSRVFQMNGGVLDRVFLDRTVQMGYGFVYQTDRAEAFRIAVQLNQQYESELGGMLSITGEQYFQAHPSVNH